MKQTMKDQTQASSIQEDIKKMKNDAKKDLDKWDSDTSCIGKLMDSKSKKSKKKKKKSKRDQKKKNEKKSKKSKPSKKRKRNETSSSTSASSEGSNDDDDNSDDSKSKENDDDPSSKAMPIAEILKRQKKEVPAKEASEPPSKLGDDSDDDLFADPRFSPVTKSSEINEELKELLHGVEAKLFAMDSVTGMVTSVELLNWMLINSVCVCSLSIAGFRFATIWENISNLI